MPEHAHLSNQEFLNLIESQRYDIPLVNELARRLEDLITGKSKLDGFPVYKNGVRTA